MAGWKSVNEGKAIMVSNLDGYESSSVVVNLAKMFGYEWILNSICTFDMSSNEECYQGFDKKIWKHDLAMW